MSYTSDMAYGIDFRKRVLAYVEEGHTRKETAKLFNISTNTLYVWEKQLKEQGHLNRKQRISKAKKIPLDKLEKFVKKHPDAFLKEIAEEFSCTPSAIWRALKRAGITLKKTTSYREQDPEKVRQYNYLHRSRARAPKGEKVYAQVSGRRFERISIVSGQVGNQFIAPMVYKGSMISNFFVKWFKESLVPSLDRPHLIVMDNASFHPKKILDQLAISNGHIFLPLPPYSPELNPIEKSWANLKKEVAEYLREGKSITDAISYCLKVK